MKEEPFVWWTDEDVQIVGDKICSKCLREIPEHEMPLLIFREHIIRRAGKRKLIKVVDVARFHWECAIELMSKGIIKLGGR